MQIQKRAGLAHAEREAELLRLCSHLEPHFVLNTLNAISSLVTEDPEQARELLGMFGDIFRDATSLSEQHALRDELAWLRRYVDIHTLRFPERLQVVWEVDSTLLDCKIPALLVQPLVENALMHGALMSQLGKLRIEVATHTSHSGVVQFQFQIADNGPNLGAERPGGKGLSLVRRRLALHGYSEDALTLKRVGMETQATLMLALTPAGNRDVL
jgi:LytS/YehU family sensor histidine kinase